MCKGDKNDWMLICIFKLYHKSKATGLYFEFMNKIIKNSKLHHMLQNVHFWKDEMETFWF